MKKEIFEKIIYAAKRAPSGDNIQPWKIKNISKNFNSFELFFNRDKDCFFNPKSIADLIGMGAFIENLKIASLNFGYEAKIEFDNNEMENEKIGVVHFKKSKRENYLYDEIFKRAIIRDPFDKKEIPKEFFNEIEKEQEKFDNTIFKKLENTSNLRKIIIKGEQIRWGIKKAHETLFKNIRYSEKEVEKTKDGLDFRLLGIPIAPKLTLKIIKSWNFQYFLKITKLNWFLAFFYTNKLIKPPTQICLIQAKNIDKKTIIETGMFFERISLIGVKYSVYIQPFASLPFFMKNIKYNNGVGFSKKEISKLKELYNELYEFGNLNKEYEIMILFRCGIFSKPIKIRTLRK